MRTFNQIAKSIAISVAVMSWLCVQPADAGALYVSNFGNNTITAYDLATGAFLSTVVTAGAEASGLNGLRVNADGSIVVAAQNTNNVLKYASNGALLSVFDPGNTGGLNSPQGLTFGPDGLLYVVSSANDKILKYDPVTGNFLGTFADLGGSGHVGPIDLAFGPDGNLYVTGFDNDVVAKIDGATGAVLSAKQGPAGLGFGPAAFGPDGAFYLTALDLSTFAGSVYRYDVTSDALTQFIPQGSGGFQSPGGLAFGPDGSLLLSNVVFDINFNDTGSTILKFNGTTGAPLGELVSAGNGLNIPFFMTTAPEAVPEPSTVALFGVGTICLCVRGLRRKRK